MFFADFVWKYLQTLRPIQLRILLKGLQKTSHIQQPTRPGEIWGGRDEVYPAPPGFLPTLEELVRRVMDMHNVGDDECAGDSEPADHDWGYRMGHPKGMFPRPSDVPRPDDVDEEDWAVRVLGFSRMGTRASEGQGSSSSSSRNLPRPKTKSAATLPRPPPPPPPPPGQH